MAKINLSDALRYEYETLFNTCIVRLGNEKAVNNIVDKLKANKKRYLGVSATLGIPGALLPLSTTWNPALTLQNTCITAIRLLPAPNRCQREDH
jgi:lysozyme family protein